MEKVLIYLYFLVAFLNDFYFSEINRNNLFGAFFKTDQARFFLCQITEEFVVVFLNAGELIGTFLAVMCKI
jgi:hypothetical protein